MAALAVAEHLVAAAPALPSDIHITASHFEHAPGTFDRPSGVLLHFHHSVEQVNAFARLFGLVVANRPQGETRVFTFAEGAVSGVPVRAWTLTDAEAPAVAA
jgi:hypothetical protein